jgi:hypothetical protein
LGTLRRNELRLHLFHRNDAAAQEDGGIGNFHSVAALIVAAVEAAVTPIDL